MIISKIESFFAKGVIRNLLNSYPRELGRKFDPNTCENQAKIRLIFYFKVGIRKSAPGVIRLGQREVTVLTLV